MRVWPPDRLCNLSENTAFLSIFSEKFLYIALKNKRLVENRAGNTGSCQHPTAMNNIKRGFLTGSPLFAIL